jgi:hypothetical protein
MQDIKIEILLKEYDSLRTEVLERIKIAFSHLEYLMDLLGFQNENSLVISK